MADVGEACLQLSTRLLSGAHDHHARARRWPHRCRRVRKDEQNRNPKRPTIEEEVRNVYRLSSLHILFFTYYGTWCDMWVEARVVFLDMIGCLPGGEMSKTHGKGPR